MRTLLWCTVACELFAVAAGCPRPDGSPAKFDRVDSADAGSGPLCSAARAIAVAFQSVAAGEPPRAFARRLGSEIQPAGPDGPWTVSCHGLRGFIDVDAKSLDHSIAEVRFLFRISDAVPLHVAIEVFGPEREVLPPAMESTTVVFAGGTKRGLYASADVLARNPNEASLLQQVKIRRVRER